jgi:hypothetical protein
VINDKDYAIIDNSYSNEGGTLLQIERMSHWKIPGYAAFYLPIHESEFGNLSASNNDAALAAGTPADGALPAVVAVSTVPEPVSATVAALAIIAVSDRRRRRPCSGGCHQGAWGGVTRRDLRRTFWRCAIPD